MGPFPEVVIMGELPFNNSFREYCRIDAKSRRRENIRKE